jgi:cytochrome bd-type quinol oxidase subunit 2
MQESGVGLDIRETVMGGDSNKDSFAWVLLLSPVIIAVALFLFFFVANRLRRCRPAMVAAIVALGLFLLAIGLESGIYFLPAIEDWSRSDLVLYNAFIAVEESGELLGSTLFLLAFLTYLRYVREGR